MTRQVLILITSDPRQSPRPAEAIRIAAGVGAWKKVSVRIYLRGPAVALLSEEAEDLLNGENYATYLPIVKEWGKPVLVEAGQPLLQQVGEPTIPYVDIDDRRLREEIAASHSVLRF